MDEKETVMTDLATLDICFAELYDSKGVVAVPKVCDNFDMSIFSFSNRIIAEKFNIIIERESELLRRLNNERTFDNEACLDIVIENITRKHRKLLVKKSKFIDSDFDFVKLYHELKRIQNELGLHISCRELNILALIDENITMDEIIKKILEFCGGMKSFNEREKNAVQKYEESLNPARINNLVVKTREKKEAEAKEPKKNESKRPSRLTANDIGGKMN